MSNYEETLNEIDNALVLMRQSLNRSEELLSSLELLRVHSPVFGPYDDVDEFERHVDFDNNIAFIEEEFNDNIDARRLSFRSDTSTVVNFTRVEYRAYVDEMGDCSDTETLVDEWEEPYMTPDFYEYQD